MIFTDSFQKRVIKHCYICKEPLSEFRLGIRLQISTETYLRKDKIVDWHYVTICEPCLVKKIVGDVDMEQIYREEENG